MAVYFITGALGAGKGLAAVGRIREYANEGKRIAGNMEIYLHKLTTNINSKTTYIRLPDRPTAHDLYMIGSGNDSYDETNNGLLVLDELTTWFNSRNWQEKGRAALLDWFIHARKYGWDVIFIVQSIETVDKQLVESLMDYHCPVSNLNRINIPIIGKMFKHFSPSQKPLKFPKIHTCKVIYKNIITADRWTYRGTALYPMYDTRQVISDKYPHSSHSQLSRWHLEGRHTTHYKRGLYFWLTLPLRYSIHKYTYKPSKPSNGVFRPITSNNNAQPLKIPFERKLVAIKENDITYHAFR